MNCLISDAPAWRAIDTLFSDLPGRGDTIILTHSANASDIGSIVRRHPALRAGSLNVITHLGRGDTDPALDLIDPELVRVSGIDLQNLDGREARVNANIILHTSADGVWAAIGSAPLTNGRWQTAGDVWTVLRSRCGCAPLALHELSDLLLTLSNGGAIDDRSQFALSIESAFALYATANDITEHEAVDTGAHTLTNISRPLIDQLTEHVPDSVQDVAIYTPTYHADLRGIDPLISAMRPTGTITIYTAKGQRLNTRTLTRSLSADGHARSVHNNPVTPRRITIPHNATVVQWRSQAVTWTLTGVSHLNDTALQHTLEHDAVGLEVAVISQTDHPLLPWSDPTETRSQARVLAFD